MPDSAAMGDFGHPVETGAGIMQIFYRRSSNSAKFDGIFADFIRTKGKGARFQEWRGNVLQGRLHHNLRREIWKTAPKISLKGEIGKRASGILQLWGNHTLCINSPLGINYNNCISTWKVLPAI